MNGQLFTQDFLARGIASSPVWTALPGAQLDAFIEALRSVYRPYSASSEINEAITESEIITKVLAQLGWSDLWLPQVTASGTRREDVPDFLLYPDEVAKAHSLKEKRDDRRYRRGIAILEAKRWMRVLDRGDATDRLGPGTPSNQILRYLSAADVASDRAVRWGMLTNGAIWRLYYQGARSRSEDFLEIDLAAALGVPGSQPALLPKGVDARHALKTFFLFFHRAAFLPQSWDGEQRTFHEYALAETRQYEERVSDDLGQRVFGTVFPDLADALASGDPSAKRPFERPYLDEVREAALILLYRLLFVLYAEDRELLPVRDKRYAGYSLRRLREEVGAKRDTNFAFSSSASRLWDELTNLFRAIANGDKSLGLPAYNGGLFDDTRTPILARARVPDAKLALVIDELSRRADVLRAWINYRDMSVQHLGSIYERLLEYRLEPQGERLVARPNSFARGGSGSYYTHDDLVKLLIAETVGPLTVERIGAFDALIAEWKGRKELKQADWAKLDASDPASRMLELRVCDPAMGSGHFLVALVDDLADRILESMSHAAELVADQRWAKNITDAWVSPVSCFSRMTCDASKLHVSRWKRSASLQTSISRRRTSRKRSWTRSRTACGRRRAPSTSSRRGAGPGLPMPRTTSRLGSSCSTTNTATTFSNRSSCCPSAASSSGASARSVRTASRRHLARGHKTSGSSTRSWPSRQYGRVRVTVNVRAASTR